MHLPDDTSTQLTMPSPSNDMLASASDGRSSSSSDATYRTTYTYGPFGGRTKVVTPAVPGYPSGRTATTVYTDGSSTYQASDNPDRPVLPGLPWTQTSAGGAVAQYNYYADGDLYSVTTPSAGMITTFTYDELGRATAKNESYVSGGACSYVNGRPVCPSGGTLTTTSAYDGLNRAISVTAPAVTDSVTGNTHQAQTTTKFDADGNQFLQTVSDVGTSTVHDDARTTLNHYNSLDQVDWSMDAQQYVDGNGASSNPNLADATHYAYDEYGNKKQVISAQDQNGRTTITDYQFDPDGRLLNSILEAYTGSPSGAQSAASLTTEARTYDPAGRLAYVVDAMGFTTHYQYYDNNLTAKVTRCEHSKQPPSPATTCAGSSFVQESDSYDGASHLTASVMNNGTTETDYAYDAAGRQAGSTLDPHGLNRTTTKAFNADDMVVSQRTGDANGAGTTDYQYNADGAMTAQSVENYTSGAPTGWWRLNDGTAGANTPTTAHDWSGQNNTAALNSGVTWASGAASFNGTSGSISTGAAPLNTAASYSVSAWVNASSDSSNFTILSQSGNSASAFLLQNDTANQAWRVAVSNADTTSTTHTGVESAKNSVATGAWTLLTATIDPSSMTMTLYVNSAPVGSTTLPALWNATGPMVIGAGKVGGAMTQFLPGQVANVQVYPRVLTQNDVTTLYANGNGRTGTALSSASNTTTWALDGRDLPISMTDAKGLTTNYVYDEAGRRAVTQEPAVTSGTYSASTSSYTTASPAPPTTRIGYDTFGDVLESKDATGVETTTTYDLDGRPTATNLPDYQQPGNAPNNQLLSNQKATTQYNELGQPIHATDPTGVVTTYGYDQLGHRTTQTQDDGGPNQATTTTAYDLDGDATQVTDPTGDIRSATYDYLGRTLTATQVLGLGGAGSTQLPSDVSSAAHCTLNNTSTQSSCETDYAYTDAAGFLSAITSPSGKQSTQYGYDTAGERTSVTDGASQTTTTGYDYAGRAIKTTLPDNTYSTTTYDQAGQVTAQAQYDAANTLLRSSSATYDADGNVLSTTDPNGNTSHYTYDDAGRLTSEAQPASYTSNLPQVPSVTQTITTSFGYDGAGRQTEYISGGVNTGSGTDTPSHWYTTYNSRGLPETSVAPPTTAYPSTTDPTTTTTTTTYDADGRPVEQHSPGGVVQTQTYDHLGDVISQGGSSTNTADAPTATRAFTYYSNGLMRTASTTNTATSGSNATSESFTYDDSGALASTSGTAGTSSFAYTSDGQMASRTDTVAGTQYPTGYSYDGAGRLKSINEPLTNQTLTYAYTPNSPDYTITYGAVTGADVRTFHYNTAHELAADTLKTPGSSGSSIASIAYGYDANGNETSKTTTGFAGAATNTYTYDQANRLKSWSNGTTVTGYGYDEDSNRINVGSNTFKYDARDELTSDGTNTYAYSPRGTLLTTTSAGGTVTTTSSDAHNQQTVSGATSYTYDALGRVIAVGAAAMTYSGMGNQIASDTSAAIYTRDPSGAIIGVKVSASSPGTIAYADQHSDLVGRFQPTDTTLSTSTAYGPLGNVLATVGNQVALGYQSEYTNAGKVNMASRWYNPATGQFTSKDTSSNSPVPNSANANPFAYGNDNPLTSIDLDGHRAYVDDGNNQYGEDAAAVRETFHRQYVEYTDPNYIRYFSAFVASQTRVSKPNVVSDAKALKLGNGPTCSSYMALQMGCTPGQPIQSSSGPSAEDVSGILAGGSNMGTAAGVFAACDGIGLGPEDVPADFICGIIAGLAGGAASQTVECDAHGGDQCSAKAFAGSMLLNGTVGLAGSLTVAVACKIMCSEADGLIPGLFQASDDAPKRAGPGSESKPVVDGPPMPGAASGDAPGLDSAGDIRAAKEASKGPSHTGGNTWKAGKTTQTSEPTPTTPKAGGGTGSTDVAAEPTTPVARDVSPTSGDPAAPAQSSVNIAHMSDATSDAASLAQSQAGLAAKLRADNGYPAMPTRKLNVFSVRLTYESSGEIMAEDSIANSGFRDLPGTVARYQGEPLFDAARVVDSEVKYFTSVARRIDSGELPSFGVIDAYSERAVCTSCQGLIQQFSSSYPGYQINIYYSWLNSEEGWVNQP